ncbi:MFS general substrate transporter [Aureobasidium pullulans]|nr:MFS general substrate transporter [Aureobasidium pullulans]
MDTDLEKQEGLHEQQHRLEEAESPHFSKESFEQDIESSGSDDNGITLKRTTSRKPPHPTCPRCKQGLTDEEGEPCHDHDGFETDPNIVLWDSDDDPARPMNWPMWRKVCFSTTASCFVIATSMSASIFGPATRITAQQYGVSHEVMNLGITLHILGFAAGPLIFGPMSEVWGRTIPLWTGLFGLGLWQIPEAVASNVQTILVCRFLQGLFGSAIFAVVSGMFVDIWPPITRGVGLGLSSTCINLGSTFAPIIGAYATNHLNWRWTAWLTLIFVGLVGFFGLLIIRETFEPVLLKRKAKRLRRQTGNSDLHAKFEETPIDIKILVQKYATKPVRMFVQEPILIFCTIYLTIVYGTLFLSYQAIPFSFRNRGWSPSVSYLPFAAVTLGIITAGILFSIFTLTWYKKRWLANQGAEPEDRLPPMILGAIILPPSLFWLGWSQDTHWASQVIAAFFVGLGLLLIFIAGIVYIVDTYLIHSNSAMSIHIVVRSIVSSSFPLFAGPMFEGLGTGWACSVLAFVCLVMVPVPIVFFKYGKTIRSWSRFSFVNN